MHLQGNTNKTLSSRLHQKKWRHFFFLINNSSHNTFTDVKWSSSLIIYKLKYNQHVIEPYRKSYPKPRTCYAYCFSTHYKRRVIIIICHRINYSHNIVKFQTCSITTAWISQSPLQDSSVKRFFLVLYRLKAPCCEIKRKGGGGEGFAVLEL